jgi:hypothetical protein
LAECVPLAFCGRTRNNCLVLAGVCPYLGPLRGTGGRAELLYMHVLGYDRGEAEAISIRKYEIRGEPDLTNAVGPAARRYSITAVIAGRKEKCGVQVTLRRQPGGEVAVDTNAAEAQAAAYHDRLVLSDGTTVGCRRWW